MKLCSNCKRDDFCNCKRGVWLQATSVAKRLISYPKKLVNIPFGSNMKHYLVVSTKHRIFR